MHSDATSSNFKSIFTLSVSDRGAEDRLSHKRYSPTPGAADQTRDGGRVVPRRPGGPPRTASPAPGRLARPGPPRPPRAASPATSYSTRRTYVPLFRMHHAQSVLFTHQTTFCTMPDVP